jgi:hypothetical protein
MAMIQDLPPEIFIRILELFVGENNRPNDTPHDRPETRTTFVQTSLVARSWRAPSQQVLAATFSCSVRDSVWKHYAKSVSEGVARSPKQMKGLLLVLQDDSAV